MRWFLGRRGAPAQGATQGGGSDCSEGSCEPSDLRAGQGPGGERQGQPSATTGARRARGHSPVLGELGGQGRGRGLLDAGDVKEGGALLALVGRVEADKVLLGVRRDLRRGARGDEVLGDAAPVAPAQALQAQEEAAVLFLGPRHALLALFLERVRRGLRLGRHDLPAGGGRGQGWIWRAPSGAAGARAPRPSRDRATPTEGRGSHLPASGVFGAKGPGAREMRGFPPRGCSGPTPGSQPLLLRPQRLHARRGENFHVVYRSRARRPPGPASRVVNRANCRPCMHGVPFETRIGPITPPAPPRRARDEFERENPATRAGSRPASAAEAPEGQRTRRGGIRPALAATHPRMPRRQRRQGVRIEPTPSSAELAGPGVTSSPRADISPKKSSHCERAGGHHALLALKRDQ